jgi:hypothetical protein
MKSPVSVVGNVSEPTLVWIEFMWARIGISWQVILKTVLKKRGSSETLCNSEW